MTPQQYLTVGNWLGGVDLRVRNALKESLPEHIDIVDRNLNDAVQAAVNALINAAFDIENARAGVTLSAILRLQEMVSQLEFEIIQNRNKLEILLLDGQIQAQIAELKGKFKNDMAVVEGLNKVEMAKLEAEKRFEITTQIISIERQG